MLTNKMKEVDLLMKKQRWIDSYRMCEEYYKKNQHLNIPSNYKTEDGYALGNWLSRMRFLYKKGTLAINKIKLLEKIKIDWNLYETYWNKMYNELKKYYEEKKSYNTLQIDNPDLYTWKKNQNTHYNKGKLKKNKQILLIKIDALTQVVIENKWEMGLKLYKEYCNFENTNKVSINYVTDSRYSVTNFALGVWVRYQIRKFKNHQLTDSEKSKLEEVGFIFNMKENDWIQNYQICENNKKKYGYADICRNPEIQKFIDEWISTNKKLIKKNKLKESKIKKLKKLGLLEKHLSNQTSFPEQLIYFLLQENLECKVYNRKKINGMEFDVYIEDYEGKKIAIEYDGSRFHNKSKLSKDIEKIEFCRKKKINIKKIREYGCAVLDGNEDSIISLPKVNNNQMLVETIISILENIFPLDSIKLHESFNKNYPYIVINSRSTLKKWLNGYECAKKYYNSQEFKKGNGWNVVPEIYEGYKLKNWVSNVRKKMNNVGLSIPLSQYQLSLLDKIEFVARTKVRTYKDEDVLNVFKAYIESGGRPEIFNREFDWNEYRLGYMICKIRKKYQKNKGSIEKNVLNRFNNLGMIWQSKRDYEWRKKYEIIAEYYDKHGTFKIGRRIVYKGLMFDVWIESQKRRKLTLEQKNLLKKIGIFI